MSNLQKQFKTFRLLIDKNSVTFLNCSNVVLRLLLEGPGQIRYMSEICTEIRGTIALFDAMAAKKTHPDISILN